MNQRCPVHGFRHLGHLSFFRVVLAGRKGERCRLDEVLENTVRVIPNRSGASLERGCHKA
jgi:hypothetical protein